MAALQETALSLGLMTMASVVAYQGLAQTQALQQGRATAERMVTIGRAASDYITANSAALTTAAAAGPVAIPIGRLTAGGAQPAAPAGLPTVQSAGFLPSGFIDANRLGQRTYLVVRLAGGRPEGMVITAGGQPADDLLLGAALNGIGSAGGAMMARNAATGQVMGYRGGWQVAAGDYTSGAIAPAVGHLAYNVMSSSTSIAGPWLWRSDTGNPESNRMHASIDVNGNDLDNVGEISAAEAALKVAADLEVAGAASADLYVAPDTPATADTYAGHTYYMRPDDRTKLATLSADTFDISAQIAQSVPNGKNYPAGMTIADALPDLVIAASYYAEDNTVVPKPVCAGSANRTDLARIFAMPVGTMDVVSPNATTTATVNYSPVPVVSNVTLTSSGFSVGLNKTMTTVNSYNGINLNTLVDATAIASTMYATDLGSAWLFRLSKKSWAYPSGTPAEQARDPAWKNVALIQTACYYGSN